MAKQTDAKIAVKKDDNFSEWFTELMKKAELADVRYPIKGFPVYRSWAAKSIKKIERMWEEEMELNGHDPLITPILVPESNFHKEADHVEGFTPEVFWVTEAGNNKFEERYALRPTSETVFYDMFGKWIQSYNDLPMKTYQSGPVFRYETKMTRPFMRTRELHWTEGHCAFATEEDAFNQVKEDMETTRKLLHDKLALPHIFFQRPQWDKFPGATNTFAADVLLPSGKVLQLPSTHMIDQKFSKAFDVTFVDKDEKEKHCWLTCYGPCHSRNYGALITFHGDDQGLVLPWDVVPLQIVIVPILIKGKEDAVLARVSELETNLKEEGFIVKIDDNKDYSPGWKFNQWEMKGVPIRVEVGPKDIENNQVAIFRRDLNKKEFIPNDEILNHINSIKETYTGNMRNTADKIVSEKTKQVSDKDEIKKALAEGSIVKTSFCSIDIEGEACAEIVEKELGGEVRGQEFGTKEKPFCSCPVCGKDSKAVVYIAKSH